MCLGIGTCQPLLITLPLLAKTKHRSKNRPVRSQVLGPGLRDNGIEEGGAESLGVLTQCAALTHLFLSSNEIGDAGAERLAGVLAHCTALTHLDLCDTLT